jgi:hypothetical protein
MWCNALGDFTVTLKQRLEKDEEILESLWTQAVPGAQKMTGMPHTPGVSDKVADFAIEIADLEERVRALQEQIEEQKERVEDFISTVEPDWVRMMFRLRFIRALPWKGVAEVIGGGNTEDSVKSACYRYIASCNAVTHDDA